MKRVLSAFAAVALLGAAAPANATLINFGQEGVNGGERGLADGTVLNTAALGNLNLKFSAGVGGVGSDFAYFDDGGPAGNGPGLGVCTALNRAGFCTPAADDIIGPNEFVRVDFLDGAFNVRALSFAGDGTAPDGDPTGTNGLLNITTNLGSYTLTFAQAATYNFGFVNWIQFAFNDTEFFVRTISDVPVPGALPLLLSGLAGLGFASRRKKVA